MAALVGSERGIQCIRKGVHTDGISYFFCIVDTWAEVVQLAAFPVLNVSDLARFRSRTS